MPLASLPVSEFPLRVHLVTFTAALLVSALTLPLWRRICLQTGLVDAPGHRKIHAQPVALAGGFAFLTGLCVPGLCWWVWMHFYHPPPAPARALAVAFSQDLSLLLAILGGTIAMTLLGWADDGWELRPAQKFIGQLGVGLIAVGAGIRTNLFDLSPWLAGGISLLWLLTVVNAVNFIDNMNGLCAGLAVIAALFLGLVLHGSGQVLAASLAFLTSGAALGFLPWNYPKATAFLGDAGSHAIGFLLGALSLLARFDVDGQASPWSVCTPLLILGLPLLDLVWVVIHRWRTDQPIYVGDTNHLSHQMVQGGLSPAQAVAILWALAAFLGGLALRIS